MLPPVLTKWKINKVTENILFFAQMVEELLFNFSPDEYKLQTLNTRILCEEALQIIARIESGKLSEGDYIPVIEELIASIYIDPTAGDLLPGTKSEFIGSLEASASIHDVKAKVTFLNNILKGSYLEKTRQLLKENIIFNDKEKIALLTRSLLAELIDIGFSPEFIFFEAKNYFFEGKIPEVIDGIGVLDDFLKRFSPRKKNWTAVFRIGRDLKRIRNFSSDVNMSIRSEKPLIDLAEKSENVDLFLSKNVKFPNYLVFENIDALDPFSARHLAEGYLWIIDSFARYHVHRKHFEWSSAAFIHDVENSVGGVYGKPVPGVLKRPDQGPGSLFKFMAETAAGVFNNKLEGDSHQRLFRAFQRHDMAAKSSVPESQLLELWSAVEVLFSTNPTGPGKIPRITDALSPYATKGYAAKQAADLVKSIRISNFNEAMSILDSVEFGHNPIEKCLLLLTTEANGEKRKKLLFALGNHVLLKHRIQSLMQSFSTADASLNAINSHRKKVAWQIQRIYRARKLIVHTGESVPEINILVEYLHSFLDRVMDVLVDEISRKRGATTIDDIHLDVALKSQEHLKILKENLDRRCTKENFKLLLFGT
jgi:hypothetical protein